MKTLKALAAIALLAIAAASPASARPVSLDEVSNYFRGLSTVQGKFVQTSANGSTDTGTISIKRPGRMRFDYDRQKSMVIVGGGTVSIFDAKSNGGPQKYPLSKTPLALILGQNIDFARSGMVFAHEHHPKYTKVKVRDPNRPQIGHMELMFTSNPVELRQWVVVNDMGERTHIQLKDLRRGVNLSSFLFSVEAEEEKRR